MKTLPVHLFKGSVDPVRALLDEHKIAYKVRPAPTGIRMAAAETLEIIIAVGTALEVAAFWAALATVINTYVKARRSGKVIITTKDKTVVHAEGMTPKQLESTLQQARNATVFDPTRTKEQTD